MKRRRKKQGSLSLSVNAIVVMVIAFVVLGLALTFTKIIFRGGQEQLERAIGVPKFEQEATADNPITISDNVNLPAKKVTKLTFQYYNKNSFTATNVTMHVLNCKAEDGTSLTGTALPSMVSSVASAVGLSDVYEFKTQLKANSADPGLYICTIGAVNDGSVLKGTGAPSMDQQSPEVYEEKTFFLNVVS